MASDFEKPDKVHTLFPTEMKAKMWPLPVSDLLFVGRATTQVLKKLGIYTIGDLANTDVEILKCHLKNRERASGILLMAEILRWWRATVRGIKDTGTVLPLPLM